MSETAPLNKDDKTPTPTTATAAAAADSTTTGTPMEPNYPKTVGILLAMLALGVVLAKATLKFDAENSDVYESKILLVKAQDLQWLYLALVVLGRTIQLVNFVPTGFKKGLKGNIRSNPFFYQTTDYRKTMVLFQNDGTNGMYNRANRSVQHMVEGFGAFLASVGPVGYLFPKQTFGLVVGFSLGRVLHQRGYITGYGKHALGFLLSSLSVLAMEGLALVAFLKAEQIIA
mmetsp:Transcript_24891/g.54627  ORF Transcript_24891/g.54627 Transcript_24891/m.54627 type:complete len:230 (-) Transcript_24891:66-755(-)|eukprot:CAMPEP_0168201042 /NCGR_PEP_ID=MMETSP0139_2-20121125/23431_1 /TAXON_ID=44445 /ORGANISM="Pseudo-nitzschia australis, Strain 10249 10 AB" /LENGTH=229 /DNA_ID=CAMNT_0008126443 /DNA_START=62 /DNA_END=751 /DNA_ORIENTATION=+